VITAVKKGSRTRGLVEYLFGPGRAEEHTNQRIVGAWSGTWEGIEAPDEVQRALLAAELDAPMETLRGLSGERPPAQHVYHVSISNHAEDRNLSDEEWSTVAHAVAERLGFIGTENRALVRWIAVHHGAASQDRDHIHFQATLVREDGRAVYLSKDHLALRDVAKEMRAQFGLEVRTREPGSGSPQLSPREVQVQKRTQMESPREQLRRTVRASATAARSESEFVELVRTGGMLVRPRWAVGGQEKVVGYMVAVRPPKDSEESLVWFGGGKLDRDLTLPALRAGWEDDPTAVVAWREIGTRAAKRLPPSEPGVIGEATVALTQIGDALAAVPVTDGQAWSAVARDAAGVLSALSIRVQGPQKVALTQAAHALSRAVARDENRPVARPAHAVSFTDAARATMTVVTGGRSGPAGTVLLLHQLIRLAQTIAAANEAAGRAAQAGAAVEAATVARAAVREMDKPRYGSNGYTGMSGPASSVGREDPREIGRRGRRGHDEQRRRNTATDRGIER
jgi:hypothetical protein